jgi:hypothetical protein
MSKQIIATKVQVTRQGAQVYFTIGLPKDTLYIERIETGLTGISIPKTNKNANGIPINGKLAGTLQLQGMEKPNLCYTTDILFGNSPLDTIMLGFIDGEISERIMSYALLPFVAAQKQEPERIRFVNNYMLYGYYRDEIGLRSAVDISYTVGLYLHLVIKN